MSEISSSNPGIVVDSETSCSYFTYLAEITSFSYRDPSIPSALLPKNEPLFLDDEDIDDDIQIGFDNRMVSVWLS